MLLGTSNIYVISLMNSTADKPSGQFLGLIVMNHWLGKVWIRIWDILIILLLSLFHLENRVCLSHGVQVAGAAWHAATRIVAGVGDLVQRIRDGRTGPILGGRVIDRSGDTVCDLHRAHGDEERGFLGLASKPMSMVLSGLTSKPLGRFLIGLGLKTDSDGLSVVWSQNHWDSFLWFGLKTSGDGFLWFGLKISGDGFLWFGLKISGDGFLRFGLKTGGDSFWRFSLKTCCDGFLVWTSKPAATVWWFVPQNHRNGFLVCASKPSRLRFVGCTMKPTGGQWRGTRIEI
jgi:hypothetical protein